jgi:AcrR family transcriptional regulator
MSNIEVKISTRELIVKKAIELYNSHGVEYVGVRELAKELNMKGGNITYYFPTKDDLIKEITGLLSTENERILDSIPGDLAGIMKSLRVLYENQYRFRGIFMSIPNLLRQNPKSHQQYVKRQEVRRATFKDIIAGLIEKGYLRKMDDLEKEALHRSIIMQNRFWISEATADMFIERGEAAIDYYVNRLAALFYVFATAKGKKELNFYLK